MVLMLSNRFVIHEFQRDSCVGTPRHHCSLPAAELRGVCLCPPRFPPGQCVRNGRGATHTAQVLLTNTGRVAGAHSLLGFMSPPRPGVEGAPLQELVGFDKVHLAPGESVSVAIAVSAHDLTRTSRGGGREVDQGNWTLRIGDTRTTLEVR